MRAAGITLQRKLSSGLPRSELKMLTKSSAGGTPSVHLKILSGQPASRQSSIRSSNLLQTSLNTAHWGQNLITLKARPGSVLGQLHLENLWQLQQHVLPRRAIWSSTQFQKSAQAGDLTKCKSASGNGASAPALDDDAFPPFSTSAINWPSSSADSELAALEPLDCIFVLAGGQTHDGGVPLWVQRRLDAAYVAYVAQGRGCPILVMGGGTPHRPPVLNKEGYVIHEGASCAAYLVQKYGVDPDHILKEWASYDTIANGYFALVTHAIPRGWRRVMMVTSAFHLERSQLIFEWVFGLEGAGMALGGGFPADGPGGTNGAKLSQEGKQRPPLLENSLEGLGWNQSSSSCDDLSSNGSSAEVLSREARTSSARTPGSQGFVMHYLRASDEGIDPDVIQARLRKEAGSIRNLRQNLIPRIKTLPGMHRWLHIEHKAYNVADQGAFGEDPVKNKDPAIASY